MTSPQHHDIVVIGAGIAGSSIARELLERGQAVCIVAVSYTHLTLPTNREV